MFFTRKIRIKILNKNALDIANVKINLHCRENGENADKLTDVSAITYNLENGKVVETSLSKNDIFVEKLSKRRFQKKFTLPAVKEGSIIEYSYKITSYFYFWMPEWKFQSLDYPCLWSEYKITIPALLGFNLIRQGIHTFHIDEASEGKGSYSVVEKRETASISSSDHTLFVTSNTVKHRWVMKDVAPLKLENFSINTSKYIDKVDFQLAQTYNGESTNEIYNTWGKASERLLKDDEFAATLDADNEWLDQIAADVLKGESDLLERAKKIYNYVSSNYTCTDYNNPYLTTRLYDVAKKKSGTVGDINLFLIALLRKAKVSANPVLLSTRDYGFSDPKFPLIDKLNYVICRCLVGGGAYNLDASYSLLGFGNLPLKCYNGYARVISKTDSTSFYLLPDSIKDRKVTMVSILNDEKQKDFIAGNIKVLEGYFESNRIRSVVSKNGKDAYFGNIKATFSHETEIENSKIDSLQFPGEKIEIQYDFKMKSDLSVDLLYFNPAMFFKSFRENPFQSEDRKYPVEMDFPIDETYYFDMEIPNGYEVDELPKSTKVLFHAKDGFFQYQIAKAGNKIQFLCMVKLNKATFAAEEYEDLREFFTYIVKKQQEQIVFRKKKA
jgi:hypothetical protein